MNPDAPTTALTLMLWRAALYVRPHLFGVAFAVGVAWLVRSLSVMGGACRVLCYPPFTIGMGVVAGLLGAQLYRNGHPLRNDDTEPDPSELIPVTGPARVRTGRPRLRRR